jgi:hypothetical protein
MIDPVVCALLCVPMQAVANGGSISASIDPLRRYIIIADIDGDHDKIARQSYR